MDWGQKILSGFEGTPPGKRYRSAYQAANKEALSANDRDRAAMLQLGYKRCPRCREMKAFSDFDAQTHCAGARAVRCKACTRALAVARKAKTEEDRATIRAKATKQCRTCGEFKHLSMFDKQASGVNFRRSECRACAGPRPWAPRGQREIGRAHV